MLEDNSPDTAVLHFGTNNLKNNENAENIATDILNLAISVKNEKKTLVVSGITVRNDKLTHLFPMHPFSIPWKRQKTVRCMAKERIWIVCWNGNGRRRKQFLLTTQTFRSSHPQVFLKLVFHYGLTWDNLRYFYEITWDNFYAVSTYQKLSHKFSINIIQCSVNSDNRAGLWFRKSRWIVT